MSADASLTNIVCQNYRYALRDWTRKCSGAGPLIFNQDPQRHVFLCPWWVWGSRGWWNHLRCGRRHHHRRGRRNHHRRERRNQYLHGRRHHHRERWNHFHRGRQQAEDPRTSLAGNQYQPLPHRCWWIEWVQFSVTEGLTDTKGDVIW